MTTLLVERHAQTTANVSGQFAGHADFPLTPLGHLQAQRTAEYLAAHGPVDAIYASDLTRTRQTAGHAARALGLEVHAERRLRELFGGRWEGVSRERRQQDDPELMAQWLTDIGHFRCPGGESVEEAGIRVEAALRDIARQNEGKTVLVTTHGAAIRSSLCRILGLPLSRMEEIPWAPNASLTTLTYDDDIWTVVRMGQDDFLVGLRPEDQI